MYFYLVKELTLKHSPMKTYLYVLVIFCLFFSCKDEQLPDLPPESPPKSRSFSERLIVDSAVYLMLQEQEEFYDICEYAYKLREMLDIADKDSTCMLSINAASKQLSSEYITLNRAFKIDNVQTYVKEYLKESISYSKGMDYEDSVTLSDVIVNSSLYVAWNHTFMNIQRLLQGYIEENVDYEVEHFRSTSPRSGCLVKYWYRYHIEQILEEEYNGTIGYILSGCGMPPSSYSLHDVWTDFLNYYMMYPPPYGSQPRPDPEPGPGGGEDPEPEQPCNHSVCSVCGKYINVNTRAGICDEHDYCETDGQCFTVMLSTTTKTVTLGSQYVLKAVLSPSNAAACDRILYCIKNKNDFIIMNTSDSKLIYSFSDNARCAGTLEFKVYARNKNSSALVISNVVSILCEYPTRDEILNQSVVKAGIDNSWARTLIAADATGRQEFGGIVLINTMGTKATYKYVELQGPKVSYDVVPSVNLISQDENHGNHKGGVFGVMTFHTHTPLWNDPKKGERERKRNTGPSDFDLKNDSIPGVVKDFSKLIHYNTDLNTISTKLFYYGPNRRIKK